jgi:phage major head subunit gpT-like protein
MIPSTTEQQSYGWIGKTKKLRLWLGSRVTTEPAPLTYTLTNEPYEDTESLDKFRWQDDIHGIYAPIQQRMAQQSAKWPDFQFRDLLQNTGAQTGAKQIGTDGLTHFNTAHPVNLYDSSFGTYCNDFTGGVSINGVTVGGALTPQGYATLRQEMMSRKGEDGEPLGITPNLLVVPPQLEGAGKMILEADFFAPQTYANTGLGTNVGAMTNTYRQSAKLLVVPELQALPTTWYLFDTTKAIKPLIFQQREAPMFVYRVSEQDPIVFDQHRYVYGVEARGAFGWSLPFLSSKSAP